jgi:hypothetical protein
MKDKFIGRYFADPAGDVTKILGHDDWGTKYYAMRLYIASGPDAGRLSSGHIEVQYLKDRARGKYALTKVSRLEGMLKVGE